MWIRGNTGCIGLVWSHSLLGIFLLSWVDFRGWVVWWRPKWGKQYKEEGNVLTYHTFSKHQCFQANWVLCANAYTFIQLFILWYACDTNLYCQFSSQLMNGVEWNGMEWKRKESWGKWRGGDEKGKGKRERKREKGKGEIKEKKKSTTSLGGFTETQTQFNRVNTSLFQCYNFKTVLIFFLPVKWAYP